MSPTTRNECMALTSCEKRAMKKVGYQIFVYKIIPLSITRDFPNSNKQNLHVHVQCETPVCN